MARIEAQVKMQNIYEYRRPAFGYGYEDAYIYTMVGEDGTVYVWRTTSFMCVNVYEGVDPRTANFTDAKGRAYDPQRINKGDVIKITATVKGQGEYKGQLQTEITRVKVKERISRAKTPEELKEEKKEAQQVSLKEGDFIWRMPYRQYKEHYSDCETIVGSYVNKTKTIEVIIRKGRLKNSGVRGKTFKTFFFENELEKRVAYYAVCEENAQKRAESEYPEHTWKLVQVIF